MPEKITDEILENLITEVAGDDVLPLVRLLRKKKNVSEFKLAETLKREINATRNMLYRLYNKNLVAFTRKKDKKKGWYIYYWTFNDANVAHLTQELRKNRLEKLQERLTTEKSGLFFACVTKCIRLNFDQASGYLFKCPECGALLEQEDNTKRVEVISSTITELEQEIKVASIPPKRKVVKPEPEEKPAAKAKKDKPAVEKKTAAPKKIKAVKVVKKKK